MAAPAIEFFENPRVGRTSFRNWPPVTDDCSKTSIGQYRKIVGPTPEFTKRPANNANVNALEIAHGKKKTAEAAILRSTPINSTALPDNPPDQNLESHRPLSIRAKRYAACQWSASRPARAVQHGCQRRTSGSSWLTQAAVVRKSAVEFWSLNCRSCMMRLEIVCYQIANRASDSIETLSVPSLTAGP
ncbi:MAG: hypothetical protein JWN70_5726 [Planctomycetaceae bacterium]|nr:hypothetical protein [Planctomycetaceae bacterium]